MRERVLELLADVTTLAPRRVLCIGIFAAIVAIVLAATRLDVNSDPNALIDDDRPYMQSYNAFLEQFGELEHMLIVIDADGDDAAAKAIVDDLAPIMATIAGVTDVFATITPEEQAGFAAHAMTAGEREEFASLADAIASSTMNDSMSWDDGMHHVLDTLLASDATPADMDRVIRFLRWLTTSVAAPDESALPMAPTYLTSESGRLYFIRLDVASDYTTLEAIARPLGEIRSELDAARERHPNVEVGLTGKPVLQADELRTSSADMMRASIIAVVLVTILFMVTFRGIVRPLWAVFALLLGLCWTLGATTIVVGHLNLLSMVFTIILVGVGIDFGVHIVSRYAEWCDSHDRASSVRHALQTAGRGNITGAATSSVAFLGTMLGDFRGLRELGLIAGMGLVLCLIAMLAMLPAGLTLRDARTAPAGSRIGRPSVLRSTPVRLAVLGLIGLGTLAALPNLRRVRFENNLLALQPEGLGSVDWQHRLIEDDANALWFGAIVVDRLDELDAIIERAAAFDSIARVRSVRETVRHIVDASGIDLPPAESLPEMSMTPDRPITAEDLRAIGDEVGRLARLAASTRPDGAVELSAIARDVDGIRDRWVTSASWRERIRRDAVVAMDLTRRILEGARQSWIEALPSLVRALYVAPDGSLLAMVQPRGDVWDEPTLARFVEDLRAITPAATGVPMTHLESLHDMRRAFSRALLFAAVFVTLLVLIDFRRITPTILALLPTGLALLWLLEIMPVFGITFNLANFFAIPILIGISVDNGVHLVHRRMEPDGRGALLGGTARATLTTSLTTAIGFGTLLLASHRGLQSLGGVLVIGSLASLVSSLVVLPLIMMPLNRADPT